MASSISFEFETGVNIFCKNVLITNFSLISPELKDVVSSAELQFTSGEVVQLPEDLVCIYYTRLKDQQDWVDRD